MLGISFAELVIILTVMLLVFGPDRLPALASQLARFFHQLQKAHEQLHREINRLSSDSSAEQGDLIEARSTQTEQSSSSSQQLSGDQDEK